MKIHAIWPIIAVVCFSPFAYAQSGSKSLDDLTDLDSLEKDIRTNLHSKASTNESKMISLKDALEEGLRKNSSEQVRSFTLQTYELDWKDAHDLFWYPKLNLTLNTDEHLVENLYRDVNDNAGTSKTPNGYVGLEFDDYTLFNWGRDYLTYVNSKETYKRNKKSLIEARRTLRFQIISQYFNLSRVKQLLRIKKSQLRHTSFIYRLAKEKLSLKKINTQEFLQSKGEFLRSHSEYQKALFNVTTEEENLAQFLGDRPQSSYTITDQLKYKALNTNKSESVRYALTQSASVLNNTTILSNANRSYQKALKDNLPLPKISLKLGAYRHNFTDSGATDSYETSTNNKNVELVASINMKWTIFGSGGLFNSRVTEKSYYQKRIAEINFRESKRDVDVNVHTIHRQIRFLEKRVEATQAQLKNSRSTFDLTLDRYIAGKTAFPNMKLVLDMLVNSEEDHEESKYNHLVKKILLSDLMGMEDLPGENFEGLVLR